VCHRRGGRPGDESSRTSLLFVLSLADVGPPHALPSPLEAIVDYMGAAVGVVYSARQEEDS
jgi:hypothetical protein